MEGHSGWKPNEQGGNSLANDWRSQHEPDLRKKVVLAIVGKLKIYFPRHTTDKVNQTAITFEDKIYGMAKDKDDYFRKIHERIISSEKKFRSGGTSANGANTPDPAAQAQNQGQSLPTSLTNAQTPTSQQWLSQSNIPESSRLPTQAPMAVSASQNLNIRMGEGVESNLGPGPQRQFQGSHQLLQKPQMQQQSSNTMYQHQMDQQLPKEKIHHWNQPQQHHQQMPHHRSLSPNKQSFPQSSALSSYQQKMAVPSQQHKLERKHHISQLMNGQGTQQTHLTSQQSNGEKQRTSQQNSMASFNVQGPSSLVGTQGQAVEQTQSIMLKHLNDKQRFQTAGSLHQSQNPADRQKQPYQFQTAHAGNPSTSQDSKGKMLNISGGDWREETYQKIKALKAKHVPVLSAMFQTISDKLQEINSLPDQQKMAYEPQAKNFRAGKAGLEQVLVYLNVGRSSVSEFHRDKFSVYEAQVLKFIKYQREKQQRQQAHLHPSQTHQTASQSQSSQVHVSQSLDSVQMNTSLMPSHQNGPSSSSGSCLKTSGPIIEPKDDNNIGSSSSGKAVVQHSLEQSPQLVIHSNISPAHQQSLQRQQEQQTNQQKQLQMMNDVRMSQQLNSKAELLQQHLSSSPKPVASSASMSSPQLVEQQTQEHPPITLTPEPSSERPIDRLIKAIQASSQESLAQSVGEMSSVISMTDRLAGSVNSIGGPRARLGEDLSGRTRFRLQQGNTNPTKRFKRSLTAMPSQSDSYKQVSVNKTEPSYALLQEITEINGRLVETVVSICNEDACPSEATSGLTVVKCSYVPVALSPTFQALYNSGHFSQIQPLRLLVPENYPSSPIIVEKVFIDTASVHKSEDLSARARSRFGLAMREYSEAMSLKEIAKVWGECARATMLEYAGRHGGGTFSSKYGGWETVLRAS